MFKRIIPEKFNQYSKINQRTDTIKAEGDEITQPRSICGYYTCEACPKGAVTRGRLGSSLSD
jgi:hypothetical protein